RMRIEGDGDGRPAHSQRLPPQFGDDGLMPAVHAVEVAERYGAAATHFGQRFGPGKRDQTHGCRHKGPLSAKRTTDRRLNALACASGSVYPALAYASGSV